jgi:Family of unknown function (DUF5719)
VRRGQVLAAAIITALLVGGAAYADRELEPRPMAAAGTPTADSGAWFCPHGGGEAEWEVFLQVANPGPAPATVRVRTLGTRRPTAPATITVDPGTFERVQVPADGRGRASIVEWFDQWVAVGWIAHAGGGEGGVAAEPCAPGAGDRWLLPDGTTETDANDDYVVVMNPFARPAVFSAILYSERSEPVISERLTDIALDPYRSRAIRLNAIVKGERTVSTLVDVSVGRVVAATLGVSTQGGIRSAIGYAEAPSSLVFPGGEDAGRTDLPMMNIGSERTALEASILEREAEVPFAGIADAPSPPDSGRTFPATTAGSTSVELLTGSTSVAAVRRTFGVVSDQGATNGAAPAAAWIVLPAVAGSPSRPGLILANPGDEPAVVELRYLGSATPGVTVTVPPRRTAAAPAEFLEAEPEAAVLAIASSGTAVVAAASYSLGREGSATYAVALGIPIPERWLTTST